MEARFVSRLMAAGATRLSRRRLIEGVAAGIAGGGASTLLIALSRDGSPAQAQATASTTAGLAEAINTYRVAHGKPPIQVSPELTKVAQAHVQDLIQYSKQSPYTDPGCLPHSWSTHGPWTGGCYNPNVQSTWPIMWTKPKEIANYPADGFENLAWSTGTMTAAEAVQIWSQDAPHNDVMLNLESWQAFPWKALGGWVQDGWASAWFGTAADPTVGALIASPIASPVASLATTTQSIPAPAAPPVVTTTLSPTTTTTQPPAPAAPPATTAPAAVTAPPVVSTVEVVVTEGPMSTAPPAATAPPAGTAGG